MINLRKNYSNNFEEWLSKKQIISLTFEVSLHTKFNIKI